jgi:HK97 family phage major capsid protein
VPAQTVAGSFGWVGENKLKPVGKFDYSTVTVSISKAIGIVAVTDELLRLAVPGTETFLRNALASGVAEFVDKQFIDPSVSALAGVRPGSITNGISAIAPSGTTSAALVADVGKLLGAFFGANPDVTAAALLMTPSVAAMLAGATNSPTLTMTGGTYQGVRVVVSASVGTAIVAIDTSAILVARGAIEVDGSKDATIVMDSAPTDPPTASVIYQSLWQLNLVGLKVEYFVNWTRARTSAVALVAPTAYVPGT